MSWASNDVVEAWARHAQARNEVLRAATERMFDEARVVAGARVLDLGTGTGDTALLAAERVGPTGSVVAIDASPTMVEAATRALAGAPNVTVRMMSAESLDFDEGAFDAVIARQVLMFVDLPRTLAGARRVLRDGGHLAAIVWSVPEDNPFHGAILETARAHGGWGASVPEVVRAFSLGDPAVYRRALADAGFVEARVSTVQSERSFASAAEALDVVRQSPLLSQPLALLPETSWSDLEARYRSFERDGACVFPVACLVVAARR